MKSPRGSDFTIMNILIAMFSSFVYIFCCLTDFLNTGTQFYYYSDHARTLGLSSTMALTCLTSQLEFVQQTGLRFNNMTSYDFAMTCPQALINYRIDTQKFGKYIVETEPDIFNFYAEVSYGPLDFVHTIEGYETCGPESDPIFTFGVNMFWINQIHIISSVLQEINQNVTVKDLKTISQIPQLINSLQLCNNKLLTIIYAQLEQSLANSLRFSKIVLFISLTVLMVFQLYFLIFKLIPKALRLFANLKTTKSLLLMIPLQKLSEIKPIKDFLIKNN